jgi:hypothetical protein
MMVIVKNGIGGACSTHGEVCNAYKIFVGKPEENRSIGRPRRRWENNIRMGLKEIAWEGMDLTHLAQDRDRWRALVNTVMNFRIP